MLLGTTIPSCNERPLTLPQNPDPEDESVIQRTQRVLSREEDLGRYCQMGIHQGFIEQNFIDFLNSEGRIHIERNIQTNSLEVDDTCIADHGAYPITLRISHDYPPHAENTQDGTSGSPREETIKAKYVLGTDGGHSWVRKQLKLQMVGDKTRKHFGVIDIVPITNFPDIRVSCSIHSSQNGSIMTVPREGRLVRLYVQLGDSGGEDGQLNTSNITPEMIAATASKILSPYKLSYSHCDWWSVYTVGQLCASNFSVDNRVFLAGDAVHTHSPTMGAGMNVSMQDAYNLMWKLGQVAHGIAQPHILDTYNSERRAVATQLIELDQKMSNFYSDGPGEQARDYDKFRDQFTTFLSGVSVQYGPNVLVPPTCAKDMSTNSRKQFQLQSNQSLASNVIVGQRLPSALIMNHAEANIVHAHTLLPSDGRWRILILPGDISNSPQMSRLQDLAAYLASPSSFVHTSTPMRAKFDSLVEILTIHAAPRYKVELFNLPEILHPFDPKLGYDYWKVFSNNNHGEEGDFDDAYEKWGVNKDRGCVAVVRPDQHVAFLCELEEVKQLEAYFGQIFFPQRMEN